MSAIGPNIPGVPEGWKVVRFGLPAPGDMFVSEIGTVIKATRYFQNVMKVIVTVDNVYSLPLFEVPIPEGYEWTGEFREPKVGESYRMYTGTEASVWDGYSSGDRRRLILRPSKPKTKTVAVLEISDPEVINLLVKGHYLSVRRGLSEVAFDSCRLEERPL